MTGSDHSGRWYQAGYALRHPRRALRYAGCWGRDALHGLTSLDHLSYYRAAMRSGAVRNPELAVGSSSREDWLRHGQMQFDYLLGHGLRPSDRMLEIGCGNLRAGRLFIDYLDPGNYYGLDISPEILLDGQRTVAEFGLQAKLPHLALVSDLTFGFLPAAHFSIVHAHSVFSHSPRDVIGECLCNVGRVMAPGAFFDFTFHRTDDAEHHLLGWAFYYRSDTLLGLARSHGLDARIMTDWKRLGGPQSKIRVTVPSRDQALDNTETGAVSRGGGTAISRLLRSPVHHPQRRHATTACDTEGNGRRTRIRAPQPGHAPLATVTTSGWAAVPAAPYCAAAGGTACRQRAIAATGGPAHPEPLPSATAPGSHISRPVSRSHSLAGSQWTCCDHRRHQQQRSAAVQSVSSRPCRRRRNAANSLGRWPVKRIVIGLCALAVITGASACSAKGTPAPAHTESALSQKSYKDGDTVGEDVATHGTLAEDRANCADIATEQMPAGDIQSRWVDGCVAGSFLGFIGADQPSGAGS